MNLKDLTMVLFQLELTKARLKIAELSAKGAEMEIYETVCQNLVLVHFKLASFSILEQPDVDLKELSGLILQSVRDLRKLSRKCYSNSAIESETQLLDLLKGTNYILKLGLTNIKVEGLFENLRNADFLYLFLTLHDLLTIIFAQKRKLTSVSVYGSEAGVRCVINYAGLPINIGRLTSGGTRGGAQNPGTNFKLLRVFSGKVSSSRSIVRQKSVQLQIPVLRNIGD